MPGPFPLLPGLTAEKGQRIQRLCGFEDFHPSDGDDTQELVKNPSNV